MQERKEYIEELVFGYLAGDLNEEEKKDLLTWLEADEVNKKSFSEMADSWATVHVPLFEQNRKGDFEKNFGYLTHFPSSVSKKRKALNVWLRVASVVLLTFTIGALSYFAGTQNRSEWICRRLKRSFRWGHVRRLSYPIILSFG